MVTIGLSAGQTGTGSVLSSTLTIVEHTLVLPHSSVTCKNNSTIAGHGAKSKSVPSTNVTSSVKGPVIALLTPNSKFAIAVQLSVLALFNITAVTVASHISLTSKESPVAQIAIGSVVSSRVIV